jgi:hypothetical protein
VQEGDQDQGAAGNGAEAFSAFLPMVQERVHNR